MTIPVHRRRENAGTVALEFALIGASFLGLLMVVFQLGFLLYAQTALDYAAKVAARQLQTGQLTVSNTSQSGFQSVVFCPFLSVFLSCANVVITLQPVASFQAATVPVAPSRTTTVNPGVSGNLMLLQVYYTPGLPTWPVNVTTLVGTAAYRNEF